MVCLNPSATSWPAAMLRKARDLRGCERIGGDTTIAVTFRKIPARPKSRNGHLLVFLVSKTI